MANCTSCGSEIPDDQGNSCSMCYGDPAYGSDGYYQAMLDQHEEEMERQYREDNREREE